MNEIVTARDIDIVTAEIKTIQRQAQKVMLMASIEIGRRLVEAKELLPHGEWGKWLEESVSYSQSTANNLMRIYNEYGQTDQCSLFDNPSKSQTFANLSYTQALALLAVPAEEREQFAEENNVADMSTRELQDAIRERDEAKAKLAASETELKGALERSEDYSRVLKENSDLQQEIDKLTLQANTAKDTEAKAAAAMDKLRDRLEKETEKAEKAQHDLNEAKEHPDVPQAMMDQLRAEVEGAAAQKATEELQKQLEEANRKAKAASQAAAAAEEKLEEANRKAKLQAPEVAVFQMMINQVAEDLNRVNGHRLKTLASGQQAAAEGMKKAMTALLRQVLEGLEK